jgi:hypothetical protein
MSDELLEPDTNPPTPVAKPKLSPASIIALLLVLGALCFGGYIYSFWFTHNSRIARLKAKNGDFVQLQHRGDVDEFEPPAPRRGRRGAPEGGEEEGTESAEEAKKPEPKVPSAVEKYINDMLPLPIQVIYWKDPGLTPDDVNLITEFQDLEVLSIKCDKIDGPTIERFLNLPRIRRVSIQATSLDTEGIDKWGSNPKLVNLKLINTQWSGSDIRAVSAKSDENKELKDKVSVTSSAGPSFGGM